MIHRVKAATNYLSFCLLVLLAIGLTLVRFLLLSVEDYKSSLQQEILAQTHITMEIGSLQASMRGFSPELILKDIHIPVDKDSQQSAIKLRQLRVGISLIDLILTRQLLPSSWVTLVGAKLTVVRQADGSIRIEGMNATDSEKQPLWLLSGGRYEVLQSEITWRDERSAINPVVFDEVDLLIRNYAASDKHDIHLLTRLSGSMAERLRVSMSINGNLFNPEAVKGRLYLNLREIQLAELATYLPELDFQIQSGKVDIELWSDIESSSLRALSGNLKAKQLLFKKSKQTFKLDRLYSDFSLFQLPEGWQFGLSNLFAKTAGVSWPAASFNVSLDRQYSRWAAEIEQLDLDQAIAFSRFFAPIDKANNRLLEQLRVKGLVKNLIAFVDTEQNQYALNGEVENVFNAAYAGLPQIENLTASLYGTDDKGLIALDSQQASLNFPDVFRAPIAIKRLNGLLSWQQQEDRWLLQSNHLVLNVKDFDTDNQLLLSIPKDQQPVFMDLQTEFSALDDVSVLPQYYPENLMSVGTLEWLDNAFVGGEIEQGKMLLYGELQQFPYLQGQGVFEVLLETSNMQLQVSEDWPHLTELDAEILFEKESLQVTARKAKMQGLNISHTLVTIPSFEHSQYLLAEGRAHGTVDAGLKFMQQTPLHKEVDQFVEAVSANGGLQLELNFKTPLIDEVDAVVNGVARLKDAKLNIKAVDLAVTGLRGNLNFTEKGLFAQDLKAKTLGYPVKIKVDTIDSKTSVKVVGKTSIGQLKKQFEFFPRDGLLKGSSYYQAKLDLPAKVNSAARLNILSSLNGISSAYPGLLKKQSDEQRFLNLNFTLSDSMLLPLSVNYNDEVKALLKLDKQADQLHSAQIVYGSGKLADNKAKGIHLHVDRDTLDLTPWLAFLNKKENSQSSSTQQLNAISIVSRNLQWQGAEYGRVELAAKRFAQEWRGNLVCSAAKGAFVLPINAGKEDKIRLEMAYLNLSELMNVSLPENDVDGQEFPLINISSEQLWWDTFNLGALEVETQRLKQGVRFKQIKVSAKDHQINMTADWLKQGQGTVTEFKGRLLADDMGKFLAGFGLANDLKEANAIVDFTGQLPAAPYQFSLSDVQGELKLKLTDGRISSIEPGLGRILGLIAMEQWIKRLTLDFSDIYQQGMGFNTIKGFFEISQGKAQTQDLLVDAIPAQIKIVGETDFIDETLDHHIRVLPKSSGALPIAGTIVSRIAGTITQAVTDDYKEGYFFGSEYHVTGKWDDMKIEAMHEQDGIFKKTWSELIGFSWMNTVTE